MSRAVTHAVSLLGCERHIEEIDEPCTKPTVAVVCKRVKPFTDGISERPSRVCQGHAWMYTKDPAMQVTWLIEVEGA